MTALQGVGIGQGIAVGTVVHMAEALPEPEKLASTLTPGAEADRFASAVAAVARELEERAARAGGTAADVLEAQAMMAEDPTLADLVTERLAEGLTAEWAAVDAFRSFQSSLVAAGGYLAERASDLDDVAQRVHAQLQGVSVAGVPNPGHPFILVARDLAPADTALLDLSNVLALVTSEGGPTSHTAILARDKGLVAIVGVAGALDIEAGIQIIADAATGQVTTSPDAAAVAHAEARIAERRASADAPLTPGALADGTAIPLYANLGSPAGAAGAVALGAEGVGLFRTEFLFLADTDAPSVASQTAAYTELLHAFAGKTVVVRVLDAGADKPLPFLNNSDEENPALGARGIRALRANENVLRDQLEALATAARESTALLKVMAPMVATVEETQYFVALATEYGLETVGVMVELPASALLADRILRDAAFISIGTNDLTQYTMGADRLLGSVAHLQDPWHPAVLRLIGFAGAAGRAAGKNVGICGEAAADPALAVVLVGLGATSLSMAPAALADVRSSLKQHTPEGAKRLAELALAADDAASARASVLDAISKEFS